MIFGENRKNEQRRKTGHQAFAAAKGTFIAAKCFVAVKAASPRRTRMAKKATHGFATAKRAAAKTLFIMIKFQIFVPKVMYSCTDSLGTLINYQWGPNKNETK